MILEWLSFWYEFHSGMNNRPTQFKLFSLSCFLPHIRHACATLAQGYMSFNLEQSLFSVYMIPEWNFISEQEFHSEWKPKWTRYGMTCIGMECHFDWYHANNTEKYMKMEWTCSRMKVIMVSCTLVGRLGKKNDSISIWWWLGCFLFLLFFFTTFSLSFLKMSKQYHWFSTLSCKIMMGSRAVKFTTIFSPAQSYQVKCLTLNINIAI